MIYHNGLYVSLCEDIEPNAGGYFCQVYADRNLDFKIDSFCIHPEGFNTMQEAGERARNLDEVFQHASVPSSDRWEWEQNVTGRVCLPIGKGGFAPLRPCKVKPYGFRGKSSSLRSGIYPENLASPVSRTF